MRPALGRSLYEGLDLGADEPCECFDVGAGGWLQIDGVGARVHPSLGGGGDLVGGAVGGGVGRGIQAPVLDFVDGVLSRVGGGGAQQVGDDGVGLGLGATCEACANVFYRSSQCVWCGAAGDDGAGG